MPLHSVLEINSETLNTVHISRMSTGPDGNNEYSVIVEDQINKRSNNPEWGDYLNDGVFFHHQEADGALECLSRGLRAWLQVKGSIPLKR